MIQPIDFITPRGPDVSPIVELHRGNDGYVAFTRRRADGQFENLFSVPARDLPNVFQEFITPHVDEEAFFSINAMHQGGWTKSNVEPRFKSALRNSRSLRWLTACYADFDYHKIPGMTLGQAIGVIVDAQDSGAIPPASMLTRSGRGLWAWWFLDNGNGHPERAWPESVATYKRIERELTRIFESIEPDRNARDAVRVSRIPGSLNRKAAVRVGYWIQRDDQGRPFTYRLDDLAVRLNVRPAKLPSGMRAVLNPANQEKGRRGLAALWESRLRKLIMLISHRGRIAEGYRNRTALLLAVFMHRCKIDGAEIEQMVKRFGFNQCDPPMSEAEIKTVLEQRKHYSKFTDQTIADWLDVSAAEADLVDWPQKGAGKPEDDRITSKTDAREARRSRLWGLYGEGVHRRVPSLQTIKTILDEHYGIKATTRTIMRDLDALKISRRRHHQDDQPKLLD